MTQRISKEHVDNLKAWVEYLIARGVMTKIGKDIYKIDWAMLQEMER